ncbi:hypothetical protein ACKGJO_12715 [Gracilimonas sp. Q87]|uniref:hypothetical protein n=1 Tax=Gracilimonas sp. Q87 TaxID=3384766 RepID=UPI00398448E9
MFKQTARLLIVASVLCVFLGNGVHFHGIFDHIFDHGDIHAFVHSHSEDQAQSHSHAEEFDDRDAHQHPTPTVDLTGTLTQKTTSKASTNTELFSTPAVLSSQRPLESSILLYLDLPPPVHLYQSNHFSSYSLRGPPLG